MSRVSFCLWLGCVGPPTNLAYDGGTTEDVPSIPNDDHEDAEPDERSIDGPPDDEDPVCPPRPIPGDAPFVDVTADWEIDFVHSGNGDQCEWSEELGPGVCMFDYDNDGDLDLYFVDMAEAPNRLYRNDGEAFVDVTDESGAGDTGDGLGCLAFDYDSDGDTDLYVTNDGPDRLYRNDSGVFSDVTAEAGIDESALSMSATAGDIDDDGDLDLFVARFVGAGGPDDCPHLPARYDPLPNYLYVNQGGSFVEESVARGIVEEEPTLAALFVDWDQDGDLDLWAGNDLGNTYPDRLYTNDGAGLFTNQAELLGLAWDATGTHSGCTMGVDVGDFDLDGSLDLVSTNFMGRRTLLFDCNADAPCVERGDALGLSSSVLYLSWGIGFVDFDLDGDLDLFSASGSIFDPIEQRNQLFWNDGGTFSEVEPESGDALSVERASRGVAFGDLDGDGDSDIAVASTSGHPQILRNDAAQGLWLAVRPLPPLPGTRVTVDYADRSLTEQLTLGDGYLGSSEPVVRFGLAGACTADVTVRWPGGATALRKQVVTGQTVEISPDK